MRYRIALMVASLLTALAVPLAMLSAEAATNAQAGRASLPGEKRGMLYAWWPGRRKLKPCQFSASVSFSRQTMADGRFAPPHRAAPWAPLSPKNWLLKQPSAIWSG
jgi:hypothetical protein